MTDASSTATAPPQRVILPAVTPAAYAALAAFTQAAHGSLDPRLAELVKIRASQVNGCSFCLNMHAKAARELGETDQRLDTLAAWRQTPFFSDGERAALALTESITRLDGHVPDDVYAAALEQFGEVDLAHLIWLVIAINGWNRLGIASAMGPS